MLCNVTITVGTLNFHNLMDRLPNALGVAKPAAEAPNLVIVLKDEPLDDVTSPRSSAVAIHL